MSYVWPRRLNTAKQVAPTGAATVGAKEDHVGDHDRHTTVLFCSSDGKHFKPHVCFKAKDPTRLKDLNLRKIPRRASSCNSPRVALTTKLPPSRC